MPGLSSHHSAEVIKMILVGDSGGGKTGALASLARAGYNLRIIDMDNGLDILANILGDDKEALAHVAYETITEKMKIVGGKPQLQVATAFGRAMRLMENWKTDSESLGPLETWGPRDILVVDSLTMLGMAAMNQILQLNKRLNSQPYQSDWGEAQNLLEGVLAMLYSDSVPCNVIVNAHLTYIGRKVERWDDEKGTKEELEEDVKAYPLSLGRALSPKIGRYFNHALMAKSQGGRRYIYTNTQGLVELKTAAPKSVKPSYPIETGLADYFRDVLK